MRGGRIGPCYGRFTVCTGACTGIRTLDTRSRQIDNGCTTSGFRGKLCVGSNGVTSGCSVTNTRRIALLYCARGSYSCSRVTGNELRGPSS